MKKKIFLFILVLTLLKISLSYFVPSPSVFLDEAKYLRMSYDLFHGNFLNNPNFNLYPPLYPLLLSFTWIFEKINLIYFAMKSLNAILSSLVFIPIYLIAKDFISKKNAFLIGALVSVVPFNLVFFPYVMSENLSFVLVPFFTYFAYKSFQEQRLRWDILTGLFLGLSYLTRSINIVLVPAIILVLLLNFSKKQLKHKLVLFLIAFIVILPWSINNYLLFGPGIKNFFLGHYQNRAISLPSLSILSFSYWILAYSTHLVLSSGPIFFIGGLNYLKKNFRVNNLGSIIFFIVVGFIAISSIHSGLHPPEEGDLVGGRPLGRYIAPAISLVVLYGFIGLKRFKLNLSKKIVFFISLGLFFLFLLTFPKNIRHLVPVNNMDLSYFGLLDRFFGLGIFPIILFLLLLAFSLFFFISLKPDTLIKIFFVFFVLVSLISFSMLCYNARVNWHNSDVMKTGLWFEGKQARIFFVEEESSGNQHPYAASFWVNNPVSFGKNFDPEEFDYVVSIGELNLSEVERYGDLKIYRAH